jgi:beta-lactam-binding protein with PASTA domain
MFELLTGRLPYTGETAMAIAMKHVSNRVPPPSASVPGLSAELDAFVASATERDRELRPGSAREMRRDIEDVATQLPSASPLTELVASASSVVDLTPTEHSGNLADARTITLPKPSAARSRRSRRFIWLIATVALVAAAAWGAWTYLLPHRVTIPDVGGQTVAAVRTRLESLGLTVSVARGQYSMTAPPGQVLRVQPRAGTTLGRDARVTIVGSLGPPPVPVPSLTGMTLAQATQALRSAHLSVGNIDHQNSSRVPKGEVISQSEATSAPRNSPIDLTVSNGPPPLPVPNVTGQRVDAAKSALTSAGFKVKVSERFSASAALGQVMSQSPKQGTVTAYGSLITITVSKGPQSFPAPNLVGMTVAEARAKAASVGLKLNAVPVPGATGTRVVSQLPTAGSTIRYGAVVSVYYA